MVNTFRTPESTLPNDLTELLGLLSKIENLTDEQLKIGEQNRIDYESKTEYVKDSLRTYNNIIQTEKYIMEIDRIQQIEKEEIDVITGGPELFPVEEFVGSVKKVLLALKKVKESSFRASAAQTEKRLAKMYRKSLETAHDTIKTWIKRYSAPVSIEKKEDEEDEQTSEERLKVSGIPLSELKDTKTLTDFLFSIEKFTEIENFITTITQIRNKYFHTCTKGLIDKVGKFNLETVYKNGLHPIINLTSLLVSLLYEEHIICNEMFPGKISKEIFINITSGTIKEAKGSIQNTIDRISEQVNEGNFTQCPIVFDVLYEVNIISAEAKTVSASKELLFYIIELLIVSANSFSNSLLDSLSMRCRQVPELCTVQPIIYSGLSFIKRILEHPVVTEKVLSGKKKKDLISIFQKKLDGNPNAFEISGLLFDFMNRTKSTLGTAVRLYNTDGERSIYFLNNYDYILKVFSSEPINTVSTPEAAKEIEELLEQTKEGYMSVWNELTKKLKTSGPDGIKDFTAKLEEKTGVERHLNIQNTQLKASLIKDIKIKVTRAYKPVYSMSDRRTVKSPEIVESLVLGLFQG
eukprot:GHVP01031328.1.p1 GENE.GHVP01031328.1~~GHVP01031328.1.p1  ORF type:complete len:578 (-),score=108.54 GHVP01031328.1:71-1804(-)